MSRFHMAVLVTGGLVLAAAGAHQWLALVLIILVFFTLFAWGVARPQLRFFGDFICAGPVMGRRVALTFDDGPDPRSTPLLLDWLRAEKLPATFCCIGQKVEQYPELAARIRAEGHRVENHSYAHSYYTNFYGRRRLREELGRAQAAIRQACGQAPKYYRPPVGLSNPNTFRAAADLGLQVLGWNVRSLDTVITEPAQIVERICRRLRPGAVILLHDGNQPPAKVLATVKTLLDELRRLGYEVVELEELLK